MNKPRTLFYGLEVSAPWPSSYPKARLIPEESRHQTLVFLGPLPEERRAALLEFPLRISLEMPLAPAGYFDSILFLPERGESPRVVAFHPRILSSSRGLLSLASRLQEELALRGCAPEKRPFLPHISVARAPFSQEDWQASFTPLPFLFTALHLYESVGELQYHPLTTVPLMAPFEEIEHTADVAFIVRGSDLKQLALHAQLALAFLFPPALEMFDETPEVKELVDLVQLLNKKIFAIDRKFGSPFKAVSHAGHLREEKGIFSWEMIVDV